MAWARSVGCMLVVISAMALASRAADLPATQPATTQPTPEVLALVNDLTSDQYATRQSAQKKLEEMGSAIAPQLREVLAGNLTDEAQSRVRAALHRIEENQDFGPSIITIHCHDAPLLGVLQDFASQAGNVDMGLSRPELRALVASRTISLDLDHAGFWTALQKIEDATGLHARPGDGDGRMILDSMGGFFAQGSVARARAAGPCLIIPQQSDWSRVYGRGGDTQNLNLQLLVMVEPKLHLLGGMNVNWLQECVDEKGNSLLRPEMEGGFFVNPNQWWLQMSTMLRVVPGMGHKIARLKGELPLTVQTRSETITVDHILSAKNVTKTVGGVTITIQDCVQQGNQYHVTLQSSLMFSSPAWQSMQNPFTSFKLLDESDQPFQPGPQNSVVRDGQMVMVLNYFAVGPRVAPAAKLRWEVTTESRQMKVPFELDDLELPGPTQEGHP
jgi:hypothetical protein